MVMYFFFIEFFSLLLLIFWTIYIEHLKQSMSNRDRDERDRERET